MSPSTVPGLHAHPPSAREFGGTLKLLLTSGGVTNPRIQSALVQLLGKPIAECHALCVPTAQWGHPMCGPTSVRGFVAAEPEWQHLSGLGWASLGVLELTALPTIGAERWVPWIRKADVLLVDGGDATYLCHWMRESGLADLLPSLPDTVWVGVSAGSIRRPARPHATPRDRSASRRGRPRARVRVPSPLGGLDSADVDPSIHADVSCGRRATDPSDPFRDRAR